MQNLQDLLKQVDAILESSVNVAAPTPDPEVPADGLLAALDTYFRLHVLPSGAT